MKTTIFALVFVCCFFIAVSSTLFAQDTGTPDPKAIENVFPKPPYSPYTGRNFPTRPFFGGTHLHTSYSMDA